MTDTLFHIAARIIDPFYEKSERKKTEKDPEGHMIRLLRSLPPTVEYAYIRNLSLARPHLFRPFRDNRLFHHAKASGGSYQDAAQNLENLGEYYAGPSFIPEYRFTQEMTALFLTSSFSRDNDPVDHAVCEWINKRMKTKDPGNPGPFLSVEKAFIHNILVPALGKEILPCTTHKPGFGRYAADFCLDACKTAIVFEIDLNDGSAGVLQSKRHREFHPGRMKRISKNHCVLHFCAKDIYETPQKAVETLRQWFADTGAIQNSRFFADTSHCAVAPDPGTRTWLLPRQQNNPVDEMLFAAAYFRPLMLGILSALKKHGNSPSFVIHHSGEETPLVPVCLFDLSFLLKRLEDLYQIRLDIPEKIILHTPMKKDHPVFLEYLKAARCGPDQETKGKFDIRIIHCNHSLSSFSHKEGKPSGNESNDGSDDVFPAEQMESTKPDILVNPTILGPDAFFPVNHPVKILGKETGFREKIHETMKGFLPGKDKATLLPKNPAKTVLDGFVRRILRVPGLYHSFSPVTPWAENRQYELVLRVFRKKPVFCIMPTGRGKSVAYQLGAKLLPEPVLVISPLAALIRDQVDDLSFNRGFFSVGALGNGLFYGDEKTMPGKCQKGLVSLLYMLPEKLLDPEIRKKCFPETGFPFSLVCIDEGHCISEWSHDYRIFYTAVPGFLSEIREKYAKQVPVAVLTATAPPPVQNDIQQLFALMPEDIRKNGDMIQESNFDRTELSLSVHPLPPDAEDDKRLETAQDILNNVLPRAFHFNYPGFSGWKSNPILWEGYGAGVIFCMESSDDNTCGNRYSTVGEALARFSHFFASPSSSSAASFASDPDNLPVRAYAQWAPPFCPICAENGNKGVPLVRRSFFEMTSARRKYSCSNGHLVDTPRIREDWAASCTRTQGNFRSLRFPLLIASKVYGTGIDHRKLRFVIHLALPSCVEAYYQEIGRAGRDRKHAHCALILRLPASVCMEKFFFRIQSHSVYEDAPDMDILPPCLRGEWQARGVCPPEIGLPSACDFSVQLNEMLKPYRYPAHLAMETASLYEKIRETIKKKQLSPDAGYFSVKNHWDEESLARFQMLARLGLVRQVFPQDNAGTLCFEVPDISLYSLYQNLGHALSRVYLASGVLSPRKEREIKRAFQKAEAVLYYEKNPKETDPDNHPDDRMESHHTENAIRALIRAVRGHVLNLRYQSFARMLRYATSSTTCRRTELLGGMASRSSSPDSYRCLFCDSLVCEPEYEFSRMSALSPPETRQYQDVLNIAEKSFHEDNAAIMLEAFEDAAKRGILRSFGHAAATCAEHDPENEAANLGAALAYSRSKDEALQKHAHRFFRQHALCVNIIRKSPEKARHGYMLYRNFDRDSAIRAYAAQGSAMDNEEGLAILYRDAGKSSLCQGEKILLELRLVEKTEEARMRYIHAVFPCLQQFFNNCA